MSGAPAAATLVVTAYTPRLDCGRGLRTYGVVAALARWGDVEVAYKPFDGASPAPAYEELGRVTLTPLGDSHGLRRAQIYARTRARGTPPSLARGVSVELVDAARRAPKDTLVVADNTIPAAAMLGLARTRPVVYCAHNLESAYRHAVPGQKEKPGTLRRFELLVLERATETWMVSEADVAGARRLCPTADVRLVPNVVDVSKIAAVRRQPSSRRVLFVADLTYSPNRVGLDFLRERVRPRLLEQVPDAEIVVVGRGARDGDEAKGLRMLGRVEDLAAVYASAAVVAVPLLQGGGSPLKFIEAMAYGLPVVATPRAAAGLCVRPGVHYIPAADAEEFATQLARTIVGADGEMGAQGRQLVQDSYSIEALAGILKSRRSS